jgi:hypothetical protein
MFDSFFVEKKKQNISEHVFYSEFSLNVGGKGELFYIKQNYL